MLEVLKKKAKRSLIVKLIICAIIIAVCLVITKFQIIDYIKGPMDLTGKDSWNTKDLEGKYVTIDAEYIFGTFAEETSTDTKTNITRTTSLCYVLGEYSEDYSDVILYAVKVDKNRSKDLDYMMDVEDEQDVTCKITGTFKKMSGNMLRFYNESISDNLGVLGTQASIPYCIFDDTIAGMDTIFFFILNIIAAVCIILMVISIIRFVCGSYEGYMKKYLAKNPAETMQGIELDFASANEIYPYYKLGRKYLFYSKSNTLSLLPLSTQVWAYYYRRTGKNPVSQINFYDVNKKATYVNIPQDPAQAVLQALSEQCPHIVIGYDAQLNNTFKHNFDSFLSIQYNASRYQEDKQTFAGEQQTAATQSNDWNL
ncbi:MAG: hypothetical protein PUC65_08365 [Clostridiales bacterium]|nr:hypothetical protein [Clostridiales bacterium]